MALSGWSSSNRIGITAALVTGAPCTLACWFNSTSLTANQNLIALVDLPNSNYIGLAASGTRAGDPVIAYVGGALALASSSTGYSANTWQHAAGVFTSSTSRAAFVNGGSKGTNTTSVTPTSLVSTALGMFNAAGSDSMLGALAEVGIWNVALTDDEVASLAKGFSPDQIRPQSLIAYLPLVRTAQDIKGNAWTTAGTLTVADHPRVYT
jgi:hypothetical protein